MVVTHAWAGQQLNVRTSGSQPSRGCDPRCGDNQFADVIGRSFTLCFVTDQTEFVGNALPKTQSVQLVPQERRNMVALGATVY